MGELERSLLYEELSGRESGRSSINVGFLEF